MDSTKWDLRFIELAKLVGSWSKDPSSKVGAVIVRPDRSVASVGFNGFPKKMGDQPERYANREEKLSRVVHAEVNALIFSREPVVGYTLYTYPFMPCDRCIVQMAQAGIVRVITVTPTEAAEERWGPSFKRTRDYSDEMGIELYELSI